MSLPTKTRPERKKAPIRFTNQSPYPRQEHALLRYDGAAPLVLVTMRAYTKSEHRASSRRRAPAPTAGVPALLLLDSSWCERNLRRITDVYEPDVFERACRPVKEVTRMEEGALAGFLAIYFASITTIIGLLLAWGRRR